MDLMELDLGIASSCSMLNASPLCPLPLSPPPHKNCPCCCPVSGSFILPIPLIPPLFPHFPMLPASGSWDLRQYIWQHALCKMKGMITAERSVQFTGNYLPCNIPQIDVWFFVICKLYGNLHCRELRPAMRSNGPLAQVMVYMATCTVQNSNHYQISQGWTNDVNRDHWILQHHPSAQDNMKWSLILHVLSFMGLESIYKHWVQGTILPEKYYESILTVFLILSTYFTRGILTVLYHILTVLKALK